MRRGSLKKLSLCTTLFVVLFAVSGSSIADWSSIDIGTTEDLWDVWGSSKDDVFIGAHWGEIHHYDGINWLPSGVSGGGSVRGIWGSSGDNVYAVGFEGKIMYYNGKGWAKGKIAGISNLEGVWGSSSNNVYAVGYADNGGYIYQIEYNTWDNKFRWDGVKASDFPLRDVWGTSNIDVFAVGNEGTILHYNGEGWIKMESGTTKHIYGIWGSSSDNVYAVGFEGTILHYNGESWIKMESGTTKHIYGIWGSSSDNVYAVGSGLFHYDGNNWVKVDVNISGEAIWGSSSENIYVVGDDGIVYHYIGTQQPDTSTTTTVPVTTTTIISNCPPEAPINCGNGWCCPLSSPICGYDENESLCFPECPPDYPIDCGNGGCCPSDYPICGTGENADKCYPETNSNPIPPKMFSLDATLWADMPHGYGRIGFYAGKVYDCVDADLCWRDPESSYKDLFIFSYFNLPGYSTEGILFPAIGIGVAKVCSGPFGCERGLLRKVQNVWIPFED